MTVFEFVPAGVSDCSVKAYLHDDINSLMVHNSPRPAIIVCPGGGYQLVSGREADPVALPYFASGYNVYTLTYSVGREGAKGYKPLCQLAATIAEIRRRAEEWRTQKDKIAVCGFSAGGHLAASLGVMYEDEGFLQAYGRQEHIRPDAMILSYPVITADEYAHVASIEHVSGAVAGSEEYKRFDLTQYVSSSTPPAFVWHTAADAAVPVENSLQLCAALSKAKVPFEYHVLPEGKHGLSVCTEAVGTPDPYNGRWLEWSIKWLNRVFEYEA